MTDFYNNLISLTNNLEDIAFTRYATITNINSDGTCTAKEDEEEGLTHENINTLGNNLRVGDKVVLGFVDNSIYNPVILTGGEEAYTKTETDALLQNKINEPSAEGTNGQVLTTDGEGGRTWKTRTPLAHTHLSSDVTDLIDVIYPVGSIYMSVNSVNPSTLFGGTWEQIKDTFLLSSGDTYSNGATGGSATVTLTENEMPSHTHTQQSHSHTNTDGNFVTSTQSSANNTRVTYSSSGNRMVDGFNTTSGIFHHRPTTSDTTAINNATGGGQAHENMPPYLAVNVWKRTA